MSWANTPHTTLLCEQHLAGGALVSDADYVKERTGIFAARVESLR